MIEMRAAVDCEFGSLLFGQVYTLPEGYESALVAEGRARFVDAIHPDVLMRHAAVERVPVKRAQKPRTP